MAAPRKYPDELRERATRMAVELRQDPATKPGAIARVAKQLGMHPETLRNWVRQAEIDGGVRPGTTTAQAQRIAQLEQEVRELQRANRILKTSAAFFASMPLIGSSANSDLRHSAATAAVSNRRMRPRRRWVRGARRRPHAPGAGTGAASRGVSPRLGHGINSSPQRESQVRPRTQVEVPAIPSFLSPHRPA